MRLAEDTRISCRLLIDRHFDAKNWVEVAKFPSPAKAAERGTDGAMRPWSNGLIRSDTSLFSASLRSQGASFLSFVPWPPNSLSGPVPSHLLQLIVLAKTFLMALKMH